MFVPSFSDSIPLTSITHHYHTYFLTAWFFSFKEAQTFFYPWNTRQKFSSKLSVTVQEKNWNLPDAPVTVALLFWYLTYILKFSYLMFSTNCPFGVLAAAACTPSGALRELKGHQVYHNHSPHTEKTKLWLRITRWAKMEVHTPLWAAAFPRLNGSPSRFLHFCLCAELSHPIGESRETAWRLMTLPKREFSLVLPLLLVIPKADFERKNTFPPSQCQQWEEGKSVQFCGGIVQRMCFIPV